MSVGRLAVMAPRPDRPDILPKLCHSSTFRSELKDQVGDRVTTRKCTKIVSKSNTASAGDGCGRITPNMKASVLQFIKEATILTRPSTPPRGPSGRRVTSLRSLEARLIENLITQWPYGRLEMLNNRKIMSDSQKEVLYWPLASTSAWVDRKLQLGLTEEFCWS